MPRQRPLPVTALGALLLERAGDRKLSEIAEEIGVAAGSPNRWIKGRVPATDAIGAVAAWLGIGVEEVERLAGEAVEPTIEGPDELARSARARRGRRQIREVAAELGLTSAQYRRVEAGAGPAEVRARVAAWCGVAA